MSKSRATQRRALAPTFAALADETRLTLIDKLCARSPLSLQELSENFPLSRQAVTKHLRVLEGAGLVSVKHEGRRSLYALESPALDAMSDYLKGISAQWDVTLNRLKTFVE